MVDSDFETAATWEQRVDPWMVLWPLLGLGVFGIGLLLGIIGGAITNPSYLSGSESVLDQLVLSSLGPDLAKVVLAFTALLSLSIGATIYLRLMKSSENEDEMIITQRFLVLSVILAIIIAILLNLYSFTPQIFGIGYFTAGLLLSPVAGVSLVIGFGYVIEYFGFSAEVRGKGGKIVMYIVREGSNPTATEKITDPIGGYFYMLLDARITHASLRAVPLTFDERDKTTTSPDDIRREYRTSV